MGKSSRAVTALTVILLGASIEGIAAKKNAGTSEPAGTPAQGPAVLWRDPGDIKTRNLFYGPGGEAHVPRGTFTFEREDMNGSNPKFDVVDQDGVKWRVKLGDEARPEVVASRLVWAVGYFANEDYFMPVLRVQNMGHLHRGGNQVSPDGTVKNVRLKRHVKGEKKIAAWSWRKNPFSNTKELDGLRVVMALMNNWDLKGSNNSIYQVHGDHPEQRYLVSDLGSSFGSPGTNWHQKGVLKEYTDSKFVSKTSAESVDFVTPAAPKAYVFFDVPNASQHFKLRWLGRNIPVADVRWIAHLLAQLSQEQIRDAFRAAEYSPQEIEAYSSVVEQRIAALNKF